MLYEFSSECFIEHHSRKDNKFYHNWHQHSFWLCLNWETTPCIPTSPVVVMGMRGQLRFWKSSYNRSHLEDGCGHHFSYSVLTHLRYLSCSLVTKSVITMLLTLNWLMKFFARWINTCYFARNFLWLIIK